VTKERLAELSASSNSNTNNNTTSKTLSLNDDDHNNNDNSLKDQLEKARERGNNLFIAVIALAAATGFLLLSLVFAFIRGRRKSVPTHATFIPRGAFEKAGDDQGHTYDNPYTPGAETKAGGYSRVET
jgi:hypothetical protein